MAKLFFNKVNIITVAKVGSANFLRCKFFKTKNIKHSHNLLDLKNILSKKSNTLIIIGIRNPIDRNLSYLFQTFNSNYYDGIKIKKNNYKGVCGYIHGISDSNDPIYKNSNININFSSEKIIDKYFEKKYHNIFNEWFEEFLEITNINTFDKNKGISFYNFPNNNTIMIYTLEKLEENKQYIINMLGIKNLRNINNSKKRGYYNIYKKVKEKITYKKEYLDKLLDTNIMRLFYNECDIKYFYSKYKIR